MLISFNGKIKRIRCAFLTAGIVLYLFATASISGNPEWERLLRVCFYGLVFFAPYFVSENRRILHFTLLLGIPCLIPEIILLFFPQFGLPGGIGIWGSALIVFFELLLTGCVIRYSFNAQQTEPVFCCILAYLLIAIAYGNLYRICQLFSPECFLFDDGSLPNPLDLQYLSFITLTTCGYGDIVPETSLTRLLTSFEALTGVLFVAIFVGTLISRRTITPQPPPQK